MAVPDIDAHALGENCEKKLGDGTLELITGRKKRRGAIVAKLGILPLSLTIKDVEFQTVVKTENAKEILG